MNKQELIDKVIKQIKLDILEDNISALDYLLTQVEDADLLRYLPLEDE